MTHELLSTGFKYIEMIEIPTRKKTSTWRVINKEYKYEIGMIQWFAPWRQYTFRPWPETEFSSHCLRDIADFICQANKDHSDQLVADRVASELTSELISGELKP